MKKRLRLISNAAILLSLLLSIAVAALFVRGRYCSDTVGWAGWKDQSAGTWHGWGMHSSGSGVEAYSFSGKLQFDDPHAVMAFTDLKARSHFLHYVYGSHESYSPAFRFRTIDPQWPIPCKIKLVGVPLWFLFALSLIAPLWRFKGKVGRFWKPRPIPRGFEVKLSSSIGVDPS